MRPAFSLRALRVLSLVLLIGASPPAFCSDVATQAENLLQEGIRLSHNYQAERATIALDSAADLFLQINDTSKYVEAHARRLQSKFGFGYEEGIIEAAEQLLEDHASTIEKNHLLTALVYNAIGAGYVNSQSASTKGVGYLEKARRAVKLTSPYDSALAIEIEMNIAGAMYYNLEYEKCLNAYKALAAKVSPRTQQAAQIYRGMGNAYWGLNDLKKAGDSYAKSLKILKAIPDVSKLLIGRIYHAQGYIHLGMEDNQAAFESFTEASTYFVGHLPKVHPSLVWLYGDLGRAKAYMSQYEEALGYYQHAIKSNIFGYDENNYLVNPPLENVNDEFQHFMILKLKADALGRLFEQTQHTIYLEAMLSTYQLADNLMTDMRMLSSTEEDGANINMHAWPLYFEGFSNLLAAMTYTQNAALKELAHEYMDKIMYSQVHSSFIDQKAHMELNLPDGFLEAKDSLIQTIGDLKNEKLRMAKEKNDSISVITDQLFESSISYEEMMANIKHDHKAYFELQYGLPAVSIAEVQRELSHRKSASGIISFFTTDEKVCYEVFTADTVALGISVHHQDVVSLAARMREGILAFDDSLYSSAATALYKALLSEPMEVLRTSNAEIESLIIIPDLKFHLIPFEILIDEEDKFLSETYDISYHYSLSLFVGGKQEVRTDLQSRFIGVAPNFGLADTLTAPKLLAMRSSVGMEALPGAEQEVTGIARMMAGQSITRDKANESTMKKLMPDAGIIHFATHAMINEEKPEESYLQLDMLDSNGEDGRLHFFEIYNLKLNAQLVTLSACNTGAGRIREGEGVMSLSRAFAYAGVPATLVSLWPASDKSTPEIMQLFYENLRLGQDKSEALNNARKSYLATATGKARHPFYWGGFIVIGDDRPIEFDTTNTGAILGLLFLVAILPLVLVIKKKYLTLG